MTSPLVMGNEFVGVIEETGERVYGRMPLDSIGAFAEYVSVPKNSIDVVPSYLTNEEAAAVPLTGLTAVQTFDLLGEANNRTVFLSGGTGSLGSLMIPIGTERGFSIVTNGSAKNKDRVMALGAKQFLDYKTEDYLEVLPKVDCVIDTLGAPELDREFGVLKEGGTLVSLRGMPNGSFAKRMGMSKGKQMLFSVAGMQFDKKAKKNNQKYEFLFVKEDGAGLEEVSELLERTQLRPSVDAVFSLDDVNEALQKVAAGGSSGKTVLKIAE